MTNTCKNCNKYYQGNFCNNCGQKNTVGRFTFKNIFSEAFHAFTHADKSILVTLKKLMLHPGTVAYEYIIACKRKKYFNLFTFFLLATAIAAFVGNKNLAIRQAVFHNNNEYGRLFNVYSKLLSLGTIPVLALFLWLINFRNKKMAYSEYIVFGMILMCAGTVLDIVVNSINIILTGVFKSFWSVDDNMFYPLLLIIYIAYANFNFHKPMHPKPWVTSVLSGIAFCATQVLIAMFIVWAIFRDFNGLGTFNIFGFSNR